MRSREYARALHGVRGPLRLAPRGRKPPTRCSTSACATSAWGISRARISSFSGVAPVPGHRSRAHRVASGRVHDSLSQRALMALGIAGRLGPVAVAARERRRRTTPTKAARSMARACRMCRRRARARFRLGRARVRTAGATHHPARRHALDVTGRYYGDPFLWPGSGPTTQDITNPALDSIRKASSGWCLLAAPRPSLRRPRARRFHRAFASGRLSQAGRPAAREGFLDRDALRESGEIVGSPKTT